MYTWGWARGWGCGRAGGARERFALGRMSGAGVGGVVGSRASNDTRIWLRRHRMLALLLVAGLLALDVDVDVVAPELAALDDTCLFIFKLY